MFEKTENTACAEALARLLVDQIGRSRRRRARGAITLRPRTVPSFGLRRRDSLEGYVVAVELDEATVMAEGGHFAFQTSAYDLTIGQRVRFVREGDQFALV